MRASRSMIVIGASGAAAALFLAALATDLDLVESLTGTPVPTIWATFARYEQVILLAAVATAVLVAVLIPRSRVGVLVILVSAATGAFLVWQGRADAIAAAEALATDLDGAVRDGVIAWSPGVGSGPGFLAALTGWGAAVVGALWGVVSSGRAGGAGETRAGAPESGPEMVEEPRYLDVIIEKDEALSVGE